MMIYKGYTGEAEFDAEDHVFSGSVTNIRDVITFQGKSLTDLETAFRDSVDDYLAWCKEDGVPPEKPHSEAFHTRLPARHQRAAAGAKRII